jgi:sigma-B regulation protein RsbU (phosphoserine phosphatase)
MESELKIAHDIQMSILPKTFPPFPTRDEFDLYALITPAREVGGDFYDFFQLSENLLCFVIGDVSGKGVPAALFMAITKTLIKSFAREDVSPDAILAHVNGELAADNDACMFVTLFCGLLDMASGEIRYANAGHNPPVLIKKNGSVDWLPRAGSLVAGAMPGVEFKCEQLRLEPGDSLFLYTDGVTEAMNKVEELFSEEKLIRELAGAADLSIKDAIGKVMNAVHLFSDGAPQSDDITMMMIRYTGGK